MKINVLVMTGVPLYYTEKIMLVTNKKYKKSLQVNMVSMTC